MCVIIRAAASEPESDDFVRVGVVGAGVEWVSGVGVGVGRKKPTPQPW